jgi:hypothetical protein
MPDWIERPDDKLISQSKVFSAYIIADPSAYGTTPLVAADLADRQAAFAAAYLVTTKPTGNSAHARIVKNDARARLVELMRVLARTIRVLPTTDGATFATLAMPVPQGRRMRVPAPLDTPSVRLGRPDRRVIPVSVRSTLAAEKRGLPDDVKSVQVFGFAGDDYPAADERWRLLGTFTTTKFNVEFNFPDVRSGDRLWVTARFINAKAEGGAWSTPAYTYAAGPVMQKANNIITPGRAA